MDELLNLTAVLGAAGGLALWVRGRAREAKQRSTWIASRNESRRLAGCREVLRRFRNEAGFLLADAFAAGELDGILGSGIAPGELSRLLLERCHAVPGLPLGLHPTAGGALPITLTEGRRARHLYFIGKSGMGKTTAIRNLSLSDMRAGQGVAALGPEAELFEDELLPYIPESRWADVVYVNPADCHPVPLNPLHLDEGEDPDLKADELLSVFQRMAANDGTGGAPRTETILRAGIPVLIQVDGTLLDFERLLDRRDASYRDWALSQIPDERLRAFWRNVYPEFPRDAHLPLLNRLQRFLGSRVVRNMLCEPGRSLNIRSAMDGGKILLFNLSDGILGEVNAQILGQFIVAKLQIAAMSRADTAPERRRPFAVYIDEFQSFVDASAASYERLLSRARKYKVSLTLAHQQLGQVPEEVLRQILGNVGTLVAFRVSATDARRLSREFVGEIDGEPAPLDPKELLSLGVGETWARIGESVLFLKTSPPPLGGSARARDEVIRRSRVRHGSPDRALHTPDAARGDLSRIDPGAVF